MRFICFFWFENDQSLLNICKFSINQRSFVESIILSHKQHSSRKCCCQLNSGSKYEN
ncbi:hypothetical protein HMPREF0541_00723 [Lacticaseibacillus rhamnosus ATCC 21052]|nr:hypothetical protein HMPREF0541_00723 [Lacticaseibacillus rhamnosus ATCC 21052]